MNRKSKTKISVHTVTLQVTASMNEPEGREWLGIDVFDEESYSDTFGADYYSEYLSGDISPGVLIRRNYLE